MKDGLKLRDVLLRFAADCLVALALVWCIARRMRRNAK